MFLNIVPVVFLALALSHCSETDKNQKLTGYFCAQLREIKNKQHNCLDVFLLFVILSFLEKACYVL